MKIYQISAVVLFAALILISPSSAAVAPLDDGQQALAEALGQAEVFVELDPESFDEVTNTIYSYPIEISPKFWLQWAIEWNLEDGLGSSAQIDLAGVEEYTARNDEDLTEIFLPNDPQFLAEFYAAGSTSLCDNRAFMAEAMVILDDGNVDSRWVGVELKAGEAPATLKADDVSCPWLVWNCGWREKKCQYTVSIGVPPIVITQTKTGKCTPTPAILGCWCV